MTIIYPEIISAGDVGVVLKLDTGQNLATATLMKINCTKPDGVAVVFTATPINITHVTYTTVTGDLTLPGDYILQNYVEWTAGSVHTGEPVELHVRATDLTGLLTRFRTMYPYIDAGKLPYEKFALFHALAVSEHAQNLVRYGNTVLDAVQTNACFCHLMGDYFEKSTPDWAFNKQTTSPGVTFERVVRGDGRPVTAARRAYEEILINAVAARTSIAKPYYPVTTPVFTKGMMDNV